MPEGSKNSFGLRACNPLNPSLLFAAPKPVWRNWQTR
jgi:hypothetical protein